MAGFHPKITASALAGAATGLLVAEAQRRGISIDAGEAADITVLLSFLAGYFTPSNGADAPPAPEPPAPVVQPPAPVPALQPVVPVQQ